MYAILSIVDVIFKLLIDSHVPTIILCLLSINQRLISKFTYTPNKNFYFLYLFVKPSIFNFSMYLMCVKMYNIEYVQK